MTQTGEARPGWLVELTAMVAGSSEQIRRKVPPCYIFCYYILDRLKLQKSNPVHTLTHTHHLYMYILMFEHFEGETFISFEIIFGLYQGTVEPRYYVPRLQRFHPYNVQIPKSRISVMHYIFYRYRLQRTPLQRNFRYNVQISRKNMKNGLRYNVQRGSISAVKRAKLPANTCRSEQLA